VDNACREQPSALADYERSPAIYRRVSVENGPLVAERRLNRTAFALNSMNIICLADFGRRYATRFAFGFQARAKARAYVRSPLSRQPSALADYERSPAIDRRVSMESRRLVA
jgi:hypothetical protein